MKFKMMFCRGEVLDPPWLDSHRRKNFNENVKGKIKNKIKGGRVTDRAPTKPNE